MSFKCQKCGKCCSNFLPLSSREISIMKNLGVKENKLILREDWYMLCPFLTGDNKCSIYNNRPMICREFDCDKNKKKIYSDEMFKFIQYNDMRFVDVRKEVFGGKPI